MIDNEIDPIRKKYTCHSRPQQGALAAGMGERDPGSVEGKTRRAREKQEKSGYHGQGKERIQDQ